VITQSNYLPENAVGRPVVVRNRDEYLLIYCARRLNETYRIYVANSDDGISWRRTTEPLIDVSQSGWDSEMVCYGSLLEHPNGTFLLYNGNAYGKDGFGVARLNGPISR
jgi:predicted GH43/DUF377 family glycosyl hydrolase